MSQPSFRAPESLADEVLNFGGLDLFAPAEQIGCVANLREYSRMIEAQLE